MREKKKEKETLLEIEIKTRRRVPRRSNVTIAPIEPTCFIVFRVISGDRATQGGNFEARGDERGRYDDYRE